MNAKPTREHLNALVSHVVSTLPDSFRARKILLVTLVSLLPKNYDDRHRVMKMLEALRAHEATQLTFAPIVHDGHGHNS